MITDTQKSFLALVEAGLFSAHDSNLNLNGKLDWSEVYRLAEEQSVVGLVAEGIEQLKVQGSRLTVTQEVALTFAGSVMQLEKRNQSMNEFVAKLNGKLRDEGIYALLVKGQGVAQSYERPLWRACGDVDLLLSEENYNKAREFLPTLASSVEVEDKQKKHYGMTIDDFLVELHGALPFSLSRRVDKVVKEAQDDCFYGGNVRSWVIKNNLNANPNPNVNRRAADTGDVVVLLPAPNNDVIFVFTHFLHHFFIEGVGLRQICDWCRLLWTYRDTLDYELLKKRIRKAGLMSEWKAFYNLASRYLGMPDLGSGFLAQDLRFDRKADRIMELVLKAGNFGHNKDLSYRTRYKGMAYKMVSLWRRFIDFARMIRIFPLDAPRFFLSYVFGKI